MRRDTAALNFEKSSLENKTVVILIQEMLGFSQLGLLNFLVKNSHFQSFGKAYVWQGEVSDPFKRSSPGRFPVEKLTNYKRLIKHDAILEGLNGVNR